MIGEKRKHNKDQKVFLDLFTSAMYRCRYRTNTTQQKVNIKSTTDFVFLHHITMVTYLVILVFVKGTKYTDAGLTLLTVISDHFLRVFLTLDVLLYLNVKYVMVPRHFGFSVHVYTVLTEKLKRYKLRDLKPLTFPGLEHGCICSH